mmetsp:Transcript_79728/g.223674  ORF Transcript_79728/g.223674 Transcript_79728/m.223674 type:complete len:206 (-) Transcript_79728:426-1043(-)
MRAGHRHERRRLEVLELREGGRAEQAAGAVDRGEVLQGPGELRLHAVLRRGGLPVLPREQVLGPVQAEVQPVAVGRLRARRQPGPKARLRDHDAEAESGALGGEALLRQVGGLQLLQVLPRGGHDVLRQGRQVRHLYGLLQRLEHPRGHQRDLDLRRPRPGELGPGDEGLPLPVLHHPLHAQPLRGPAAEGSGEGERGHLPVRRL